MSLSPSRCFDAAAVAADAVVAAVAVVVVVVVVVVVAAAASFCAEYFDFNHHKEKSKGSFIFRCNG